ncbi:hypothetical protein HDU83_009446 [Entophlyctis luteolus]|nr:hypothetical protein HDU83_009446 [Entophlyctis luteolus]
MYSSLHEQSIMISSIPGSSASNLGYINDPFIHAFVKNSRMSPRKMPIINRGSYSRFVSLHAIIKSFLLSSSSDGPSKLDRQISESIVPRKYIEIDHVEVTSKKAFAIKKNKQMTNMIGEHKLASGGTELHGNVYALLGGDLRNWEKDIVPKLNSVGFDPNTPTLFLAECLFVYLPADTIDCILHWCANVPIASTVVAYDQIHPDDAFGQMMLENLKLRNIHLPGLLSCPTLDAHIERFKRAGFNTARAITMREHFDKHVSSDERARLARIEVFDEVEEWSLMADHYCISWAWQDRSAIQSDGGSVSSLATVGL